MDELGAYVLLYVSYEVGADGAFYNSAISYVWTDDLMNGTWHYGSNGIDNDVVGYDTSVLVSGDHGNVISDTSGRYVKNQETGEMEFTDFATYISGNNHGGMAKVNGKWYFFGHRQTNARQRFQTGNCRSDRRWSCRRRQPGNHSNGTYLLRCS